MRAGETDIHKSAGKTLLTNLIHEFVSPPTVCDLHFNEMSVEKLDPLMQFFCVLIRLKKKSSLHLESKSLANCIARISKSAYTDKSLDKSQQCLTLMAP